MMVSIFDDLYRLNREMTRMLYGTDRVASSRWPATNIYENENEYMIASKVPGMVKEDISISFKDNSLKISGNKKPADKNEINFHLKERKTGDFERNFLLDGKVDSNNIKAEIQNGILLIKVPKSPESKPMKIEIK